MKITSRIALGVAAAVLVSLTAGCSGGTDPGTSGDSTTAMKIGLVQGQDFIHAMPARVAEAQGFFKKEGIDASIVDFTSGSDLTKAMAGGSIDVGAATGLEPVSAAAHDVDLQAFWGIYSPSPMVLVVGPDSKISGFADLKGTKIGISRVGSLTDYIVRAALKAVGVDFNSVTEVPLGDPASTIAGLAKGDIDSFVLPVNFGLTVEAEGTGKIAQTADDAIGDTDQFAILMASSGYISSNKDALTRLTTAYTEAIQWMKDNRDGTVALAVDKLGMKEDIAGKTYDALVPNFSTDGKINLPGLTGYADALPELGIADSSPAQSAYYSDAFQK